MPTFPPLSKLLCPVEGHRKSWPVEKKARGRRRNKRTDYSELLYRGRAYNLTSQTNSCIRLLNLHSNRHVRNFDKPGGEERLVGLHRQRKRRRSLKKGNRKKRQTSVIGILVIFLGTKEAFLVTGSLVPQWRFDATRLELDSNQPVCLRAPEQISPVEKNSHAMLVNKLEIGIAVSQSVR